MIFRSVTRLNLVTCIYLFWETDYNQPFQINQYHYFKRDGLNYGHAKTGTFAAMVWYSWGNKLESLRTNTMAIRRADIPGDN